MDAVAADIRRVGVDAVVHAGDLVVTGPRPAEVVNRIRELGWDGVVGNTDQMLWDVLARSEQLRRAPKLAGWLEVLFDTLAPWAKERLGADHLQWLRALPAQLAIDNTLVMHASPTNLWRAPMPDAHAEEFSATYGAMEAAVTVYGHIHRPFVRELAGLTVVNCGSVGLPYDGDRRASYALIDEGLASIRRVEYDLEREGWFARASGFPLSEWLAEVQREGRFFRPGRLSDSQGSVKGEPTNG